MTAPFKFEIL
jgi:hypothetical protein